MSLFREEVSEHRRARLHGEVVLSQPISTRIMVGALFAVIALAGTWVALGTYARIETVPGVLTTDIPSAKIIAPQPGLVATLSAQEGQLVKAGDLLAVVSLERRAAAGKLIAGRGLDALVVRRDIAHLQVGLSAQRTAAERSRLMSAISASEAQAASLREQIAMQEQVVESNKNMFDQIANVVERGFVSKVELERRRQTLISSQQQVAGLRQQLWGRMADTEQARAQIASLAVETAQSVSNIQSDLQAIAQQQAQLEGEQGYIVTAPIAGRVTALQIAVGRTVSPNFPLMTIVPERSRLKAELYAPTRAIGFVRPGQEVRILYDAFPYRRFGSFGGKVQSVSRIVIDPRESEASLKLDESVYRVAV